MRRMFSFLSNIKILLSQRIAAHYHRVKNNNLDTVSEIAMSIHRKPFTLETMRGLAKARIRTVSIQTRLMNGIVKGYIYLHQSITAENNKMII